MGSLRMRSAERLRTGSLRVLSAEGSLGSAEGDLTDQVTIECSATLKVGPCTELLTGSESRTPDAGELRQTGLPRAHREMLKLKASEHRERGVRRGKAAIFALRPLTTYA